MSRFEKALPWIAMALCIGHFAGWIVFVGVGFLAWWKLLMAVS